MLTDTAATAAGVGAIVSNEYENENEYEKK